MVNFIHRFNNTLNFMGPQIYCIDYNYIGLPKAKVRKEKKSQGEKVMEKAIDSFIQYQKEAEEKFLQHEEESRIREMELEERRRKQDQEHEIRLFQMIGQFLKPPYDPFPYNNEY